MIVACPSHVMPPPQTAGSHDAEARSERICCSIASVERRLKCNVFGVARAIDRDRQPYVYAESEQCFAHRRIEYRRVVDAERHVSADGLPACDLGLRRRRRRAGRWSCDRGLGRRRHRPVPQTRQAARPAAALRGERWHCRAGVRKAGAFAREICGSGARTGAVARCCGRGTGVAMRTVWTRTNESSSTFCAPSKLCKRRDEGEEHEVQRERCQQRPVEQAIVSDGLAHAYL